MISYILEIRRLNKLMEVVENDMRQMLNVSHELFNSATLALLEDKPVDYDLYARDREINLRVVDTRKRIVEHLSISKVNNPVGELIFITLINNIERIGDHSKNIFDLYRKQKGPIGLTDYRAYLYEFRDTIDGFFPKAAKALFDDDEVPAREVIEGHAHLVHVYDCMIQDLFNDDSISASSAIVHTLYLRSCKRVSSHLKTVSSAAVSPFMLLGYREMPDPEKQKKSEVLACEELNRK